MTKFLNNWREKRSIKRIRREMSLLGYDLSGYTDEEIKEGTLRMAKVMAQTGVSIGEFAGVTARLFKHIPEEILNIGCQEGKNYGKDNR